MFKSARWRSEKNKVKSVFKLQFHATQVSQLGVDSLTVSVIPVDIGKPSAKLEKAGVKDGGCRWENPVYETVKFSREPKTGKIAEKIYRFSVSNGSAKNGVHGEASIDFAAYAEANKASTVSLPLKSLNSDAMLHVLIQRLEGNVDQIQREVEECDEIKPKSQDRSLRTHLSNGDIADILAIDEPISKNGNQIGESNGNHRASSGSDITFSSSDSSSGLNTPRELGTRNGDAHHEPSAYLSPLSNGVAQKNGTHASMANDDHRRSPWLWSGVSNRDDSTRGCGDDLTRESSQPASDMEIEKLKAEIAGLARQANMSELELQTLRKQIVKENKRGVDLSREVGNLKEERDSYKAECDRLNSFKKRIDDAKANDRLLLEAGDLRTLVEEIRQELNHEKDLNSNLKLQLQKTQEANAELILAIQDLEEMLEQKNNEIADQIERSEFGEDVLRQRESAGKCESVEDEEQKALEKLVKEHRDANETLMMEQKITDLYNEIEIYRRDRDELEMQMEQLALDYEILKQENHDISYKLEQSQIQEQLKMQYECAPVNELASHIESLERELKTQSEELLASLMKIKELESHIKSLEGESKMRSKEFESRITCLNEELELRAKECSDSSVTIKELESCIAKEASNAWEKIKELESQIVSLEAELKKQSKESSESLGTIKGLESHIEGLNEELKKQSKESLESLVTIKELEFHIQNLEEELEERASVFEADLEALLVAKVDQEKRAIRAEESLRKMKWKNASTAEKLQEEFRRLSSQMASTFEANEKVAMKSIQEAGELRAQKIQLEEMLRKSKAELQVVRSEYDQIVVKPMQIQPMSHEILNLKAEIERLVKENKCMSEKAEENALAKKESVDDEADKEKLRKQVVQLKKDLKKKDDVIANIEKKLKDSNGRSTISATAVPRAPKEVIASREKIKVLEGQIKSKETALEILSTMFSEKEKDFQRKIEDLGIRLEELNRNGAFQKVVKDAGTLTSSNEMSSPKREANEFISLDSNLASELAILKEKNQLMESELKELQERYSETSLKFAEVEGERQKLVMTVRYLKNNKKN